MILRKTDRQQVKVQRDREVKEIYVTVGLTDGLLDAEDEAD